MQIKKLFPMAWAFNLYNLDNPKIQELKCFLKEMFTLSFYIGLHKTIKACHRSEFKSQSNRVNTLDAFYLASFTCETTTSFERFSATYITSIFTNIFVSASIF